MTTETEWIDLPTLQDVAKALDDKWEIETYQCGWEPWPGTGWGKSSSYRGRPRQPKTREVAVKMECRDIFERLAKKADERMTPVLSEAIDEIASRDAEVARLKTVPMRYRRMAFNAQLQDEVTMLEQENDQLRTQIKQKDAEIAELKDALGYDWDKYKASQMALRECMQMVAQKDAEIAELVALLTRYRNETPLGHQPHMIAHLVDEALAKVRKP